MVRCSDTDYEVAAGSLDAADTVSDVEEAGEAGMMAGMLMVLEHWMAVCLS